MPWCITKGIYYLLIVKTLEDDINDGIHSVYNMWPYCHSKLFSIEDSPRIENFNFDGTFYCKWLTYENKILTNLNGDNINGETLTVLNCVGEEKFV